jgi:hypothetical protein
MLGQIRSSAMIVLSIAVAGGPALAQSERAAGDRADAAPQQETPEEVVVRGRRIGELRAEIEDARRRAYDIFNEINIDDEFDVYCRKESQPGTNVPRQVCRAQFERRISADAASEYMGTLARNCPVVDGEVNTQACMFSGYGQSAADAARGIEGQLPGKQAQMRAEILRLANEDERFGQAILDYYEASQQYDAARKRRED